MASQSCCWQQIVACLTTELHTSGFDVIHAFPAQLFNSHSPPGSVLPTYGRVHSTLAVIVGNTNSLWHPFVQQLAREEQLRSTLDPLDSYVEQHITAAVQHCCRCCSISAHTGAAHMVPTSRGKQQQVRDTLTGQELAGPAQQNGPTQSHQANQQQSQPAACSTLHNAVQQQHLQQQQQQQQQQHQPLMHELRFAHHFGPKFINMLRAAQLSGLAYYSATTHLCMHPVYGPWSALRAVAVFDCDGPDPSSYHQLQCPHPDLEEQAGAAMQQLEQLGGLANWQQHWRQWADLRSIGGRYTDPRNCYSSDQLEYHYTKSKAVLARAIAKLQGSNQGSEGSSELAR